MINKKIKKLLEEYSESRQKIEKYIKDVEKISNKLDDIFPEKVTYRNKFILEDKIKTYTGFYTTLLNLRKEINSTIIKEIELRNKLSKESDEDEPLTKSDLRELAKQIKSKNRIIEYPDYEKYDVKQDLEKFKETLN